MSVQGKPAGPAPSVRSAAAPATGFGAVLWRGMGAGLAAGVGAGLFQLAVGERWVEQAIQLEHLRAAASAGSGGGHIVEVFTRGVQRTGMVLATGLYGIALGGILATILFVASRRMHGTVWERSMRIALGGFAVFWLVPFLKYPANPPAVGDPATIGLRTAAYLAMAVASLAACLVAVVLSRRLAAQGVPAHRRQILAIGGYLLVIAVAFVVLPGNPDAIEVPADLLWSFRLASAGGQAFLWTLTGVGIGLLAIRSERRAQPESDRRGVGAGDRPVSS